MTAAPTAVFFSSPVFTASNSSARNPTMFEIVLVEPEIPPNTGNVGRLCVGIGARLHLVGPLGFSLDDRSLKRAGLDYWKDLDLCLWEEWEAFANEHDDPSRWHLHTARDGKAPWDAPPPDDGDFLIFGRETTGLSKQLLEAHPERCRRLPTPGYADGRGIRSLNLSGAVAAVAYLGMSRRSARPETTPRPA